MYQMLSKIVSGTFISLILFIIIGVPWIFWTTRVNLNFPNHGEHISQHKHKLAKHGRNIQALEKRVLKLETQDK